MITVRRKKSVDIEGKEKATNYLLVETLVLVGDTLAVKLLVALFVGTSESIVRT